MGAIADDMVDGSSCSYCGVYFERPHGHPVLCKDCFADEPEEDSVYPMATEKEL